MGKHSIIFKTNHDIGRYDGLQIEVPKVEKPVGFSVQQMKVNGKNVFEAKAGDEVEVFLPSKVLGIVKGLDIYLASSTKVNY